MGTRSLLLFSGAQTLSNWAECTKMKTKVCFLVDKSKKERYNREVLNQRMFYHSSPW